jgi:hypothetical protein
MTQSRACQSLFCIGIQRTDLLEFGFASVSGGETLQRASQKRIKPEAQVCYVLHAARAGPSWEGGFTVISPLNHATRLLSV